ncbi:hypothetical protein [Streptomyces sp. NPDC057302]
MEKTISPFAYRFWLILGMSQPDAYVPHQLESVPGVRGEPARTAEIVLS